MKHFKCWHISSYDIGILPFMDMDMWTFTTIIQGFPKMKCLTFMTSTLLLVKLKSIDCLMPGVVSGVFRLTMSWRLYSREWYQPKQIDWAEFYDQSYLNFHISWLQSGNPRGNKQFGKFPTTCRPRLYSSLPRHLFSILVLQYIFYTL